MSSNGFLGLSPANPASKMHMPSPFERLNTGPWLDGLLEKIARGRERPPSPSPSRSPSPDRQDDVFGDVDEPANISQANDDMEEANQDDNFEDDLFGEEGGDEEKEEERRDDELSAGHYQAEHIDTAAAGSLPSSVLENALRNTEQYSLYEDEVEKNSNIGAAGLVDDEYIDRDQAYSGDANSNGDNDDVSYGADSEDGDAPVVISEDDGEDDGEEHESTYEDEYADDFEEYDEDEEVDEDDGMGDPLSDANDVIEIGDTDEEEDEEQEEDYDREYDEDEQDGEEEEQEEVEDEEEDDAGDDEEYGHDQGVYGDLYDDLPGTTDISGADAPYISSEIFDALDQQPITTSDVYTAVTPYSVPSGSGSEPSGSGMAIDAEQYGVMDPSTFSPYQFDSAAVEEHNAQRNMYPAIPTDTVNDLEAILSQPIASGSGGVSDEFIDPELQAPTHAPKPELNANQPDLFTDSIYPSLPEVAAAQPTSAMFVDEQSSVTVPNAFQPEPAGDEDDPISQPLDVSYSHEEEDEGEEEPIFDETDDSAPALVRTVHDNVIEVLSSDGEEDEVMSQHAGTTTDWLDDAAAIARPPAPIGEDVDELDEDEPIAAPELPTPLAEETETVEQPSAPPLEYPQAPTSRAQPADSAAAPLAASEASRQIPVPVDFAIPAPAFDSAPFSDNVEDELTPEPLDPRWTLRSSPSVSAADRERPLGVPLDEVVVEEIEDRLPIGLDEMVRQVIAAAEAEVAEPVSAQNTPAVDDALNIAEFFAPPQDEVVEVVEEATVVVQTGVVETPGLAARSSALDLGTGDGPVEAAPHLVNITEQRMELSAPDAGAISVEQIETIDPIEASAADELLVEHQETGAKELAESIPPLREQNLNPIEPVDQLAASQATAQTDAGIMLETTPVEDAAGSVEAPDINAAGDDQTLDAEVPATGAIKDEREELIDASAAAEEELRVPSPTRDVGVPPFFPGPDAATVIVDDSDEVVVVQPMPKMDTARLSPVATTSTSRTPARTSGIRASQSPVMPIPILLRSPVHTPPASEEVDMLDNEQALHHEVFEIQTGSPLELPDPHAPVPDTQAPAALSPGEHPHSQLTRSPSMVVEPPLNPPEPDTVPAPEIRQREETPTLLPDPTLPPADATVPPPLSPGQVRNRPTPSPSLIVEPPENPPAPETVVKVPTRENTPVSLPDPHAAPPDSTAAAPLSPHHMEPNDATPTPSIIVEPPTEAMTPFMPTSAGGSRADTPPLLPDPHAASPDAPRDARKVFDDVPRMAERAGSLSPSVEAVVEEDVPASTTADLQTEASAGVSEPAVSVVDFGKTADAGVVKEDPDELDTKSATSDRTEKGVADPEPTTRPALLMTESMRLRHHHGGPSSSIIHAAAPSEPDIAHTAVETNRRTRSTARSTNTAAPPVTRSHCFYRKLQLQGNGMSALVLVPQCTLYEPERLEEETSVDLGEATAEEEREAESRAMTEENPILHPHLALKLHRIVGKTIFDEGHCFLLKADDKALRPADSAEILTVGSHSHPQVSTPKRKKRVSDEMDDDDDVTDMPHSVTRSQARRSKRQSVSREIKAEGSNTLSTPTKSPAPKSRGLRSTSRLSEARSDNGDGEIGRSGSSTSPVKRTPRASRRSLSVATVSQGSFDQEAAADLDPISSQDNVEEDAEEREKTPIVVSVTTAPASQGTRSRRGRKSKQSPVPEEAREDTAGSAGEEDTQIVETTPTKKAAKTKVSVKPRSSARKSAAAAQEDAPYRPDEEDDADLEQEQTEGDDDDEEIQVHVETSGPVGTVLTDGIRDDQEIAEGAPVPDVVAVTGDSAPPEPIVKPASRKGRKSTTENHEKSAIGRRKSTRLTAKAKEDEAPYRPEEEAESVTSGVIEETELEEIKDEEPDLAPGNKGKAKGTKRKARESVPPSEGVAATEGAGESLEEVQVEGRATRSSKRRAVASAQEPDVPVVQSEESAAILEEGDKQEASAVAPAVAPAQEEKKSKGWFSFFGRGKK